MSSPTWPQPLEPVSGPFTEARIEGAADGMGEHGPATRSLVEHGFVPPDLICGMTLLLLARQPRRPRPAGPGHGHDDGERRGSGVAGRVWARERFTIHQPLLRDEPFLVTGESTGRYVRKGRRYGTTASRTVDAEGRPVAHNLTTGLLSYRPDPDLADEVEGIPIDDTPAPEVDHAAARYNPHLGRLREVRAGERLGGGALTVTLAMMAVRDTAKPDNPIHSDPEAARRAGLRRPIAGGSHVLAFTLEPLLAAWGTGSLSHGASFDVRWKAPTEADAAIVPTATVASVSETELMVELEVVLDGGPQAMVGTVTVPLTGR
jgi:acyl dehydratase